jgi:hypothetical protein
VGGYSTGTKNFRTERLDEYVGDCVNSTAFPATSAFFGTDFGLPRCFRHSHMALVLITAFYVFTSVGTDNSLERLTERSVGFVTDQPGNIDELFITLFE